MVDTLSPRKRLCTLAAGLSSQGTVTVDVIVEAAATGVKKCGRVHGVSVGKCVGVRGERYGGCGEGKGRWVVKKCGGGVGGCMGKCVGVWGR